jgi:hypothetical protein
MYYNGSNAFASLRQGLVGAWCPSLPNGGSGNMLPDVSGFGNHGTLTNMAADDWVSGQYGRALDFDGSNDYVNCGTRNNALLVHTKAFSISAWIYLTATTSDRTILSNAKITPNYDGMNFLSAAGKLRFDLGGDASPTFPLKRKETTSAVFSTGIWYHVAVTKPASAATSAITLFVNGVQPATTDAFNDTVADAVNNVNLQIAARDGANSLLQGQIDDLRLYSRALTPAEIRLLASRPGIGLRQESHRNTFYQFPSGARRRRILTGMP